MPVSFINIGVTLTSAGVSLTRTTPNLPWDGESILIGVSITGSTTGGSTGSTAAPSSFQFSLNFTFSTNSMYIPVMTGIG